MPAVDPLETIPPGEEAAVQAILADIERKVREGARGGSARRDAHPKAHGCVTARFEVRDDFDPSLRVGVFSQPRDYDCWVRFSNGSEVPQPDAVGDGRGMAIKLLGVPESPSTTQDFIMINHPAFFVRNAIDYVDFQTANNKLWFFFPGLNPFRFRLHELGVGRAITRERVDNPLNVRYWSMVPFSFGDRACKFSARPVEPMSPFVERDSPDFLRANLARHLAEKGMVFDFMAQLRTKPDSMPIEDPTIVWDEQASPFVPLARVTIESQRFDTPDQHAFCENLSFTPWHCVSDHRPLGGINRVRKIVYDRISALRHHLNRAPRQEPTEFKT